MDKTPTVISRPLGRDVAGVDVLFFLSIAFIIMSIVVVISLR